LLSGGLRSSVIYCNIRPNLRNDFLDESVGSIGHSSSRLLSFYAPLEVLRQRATASRDAKMGCAAKCRHKMPKKKGSRMKRRQSERQPKRQTIREDSIILYITSIGGGGSEDWRLMHRVDAFFRSKFARLATWMHGAAP
jgi:hypothetical protein